MEYYVTTPIYYVNAKPHIGSAYTTIAADVLARYYRIQGHDTHFLTGVAEHGTKIATSAEAAHQSPEDFVQQNSKFFKDAWSALNISYDDFIRTTEDRHIQAVNLFFEKLKASGKLYEKDYEGLYCVGHEAFIKESELDDRGFCPEHGKPPEKVREKNWFFKLSEYGDWLKENINSGRIKISPSFRQNEVISFIEQGLEDIAISRRTAKFALPLPWDSDQTIYVWLDELFNYCSAIGYGSDSDKFKKYWPANLHIIGKDIIKFHAIIWPAVLNAIGEEPPHQVFAHGFFTVDGQKISKTLGNVIDPVQIVHEYSSDVTRYFLLRDIPFGQDGDFSHDRLAKRYNADLANGLGNLVSRTLNMFEKFYPDFNGKIKVPTELEPIIKNIDPLIENLAFDKALAAIWDLIAWADNRIETTKPWELAKKGKTDTIQSVLVDLLAVLDIVNQKIAPFMPDTHQKINELLAARPLRKPNEPLFARK
jgi:methionyl-tRNA synthetase